MYTSSVLMPKRIVQALAATALSMAFSSAAWSATDVQVWYSLNEHNKQAFEALVKAFNKENKEDIRVHTRAFDNSDELDVSLSMVAESERPNIVQLPEISGMDDVATRSYIWPLNQALAKDPIRGVKWFLPADNNFMHNAKGQLLALPFMAEIPVMYYNIAAFEKAGLVPPKPSRSWQELQDQLVTIANNGTRYCPITSDQPVSMNLENLAAVNKQFYPGTGKGSPAGFDFDMMYIRHLSTMVGWVRSEIMVRPAMWSQSPKRFADGECAVFLSNSGNLGAFESQKKLDFSVSGIPYYPQITENPGNPFVTGTGLWLTRGHSAEKDKGSIAFMRWLSQTNNAAKWYQQTGFLPLTHEAFNATDAGYYKHLGQWRDVVAVYGQRPENTTRGFKVHNYHQIRAVFNDTLTQALEGNQTAVTALKSAATEANKLMKQR